MNKFNIDYVEIGVTYQDSGPWRSYHLIGSGNTASELYKSLEIAEVDQDGGDLDIYSLAEASEPVTEAALSIFTDTLLEAIKNSPILLNPDTNRLSIKAKHALSTNQPKDLYEALNIMFSLGYGPLNEADIFAIKTYLDKLQAEPY